jgi:hypothetical protein
VSLCVFSCAASLDKPQTRFGKPSFISLQNEKKGATLFHRRKAFNNIGFLTNGNVIWLIIDNWIKSVETNQQTAFHNRLY